MCAGAKNPLNCWVVSISLTFFVNFQFENIAYLCENVGREGGEEGDTLEEGDLVLRLLDPSALHNLLEHQALHAPQLPVCHSLTIKENKSILTITIQEIFISVTFNC